MSVITSLPMSQTKEGLRRHLNMPDEIYTAMAKEADRIYKQLTIDKRHLKSNCKTKPPYDWNDVVEKSKDDAMRQLSGGGSSRTAPYWQMAEESETSPNWIAKWFLYHKFRYRDGRNKSKGSSSGHKGGHRSSSHRGGEGGKGEGSSSQDYGTEYAEYDTNSRQTMPRSTLVSGYDSQQEPYYPNYTTYTTAGTSSLPSDYGNIVYANNRIMSPRTTSASSQYSYSYTSHMNDHPGQVGKKIFDPVKDDWVHK